MITRLELSLVIPCKNEEKHISLCLDSILKQNKNDSSIEIVVMDNGSTDKTVDILKGYNSRIKVFVRTDVSISELRNYGAGKSGGEWIAFIDADVELDINWYINLIGVITELEDTGVDIKKVVLGSTCSIPRSPTWVERIWYDQLVSRDKNNNTYINSANIILSRELFDRVGGFDHAYKTGEDEKLCSDARKHGGLIIKNDSIRVVHHGYSKSVKQFFKRERWHGLGMDKYLLMPWKYRDLLLAYYYISVLVISIMLLFFSKNFFVFIIFDLSLLLIPVFFLACSRCRIKPLNVFPLSFLYFIYGWARVFSVFDIVSAKCKKS